MKGIPDPLRQLPDFHALLDAVEPMILESYEKQEQRDFYFQKNYVPDIDDAKAARANRQDEANSFDAFMSAISAANIEK